MADDDDRYHHGNLRESLLAAGLGLLRERGIEGVTLRATARRAGVSHAAPYHHFPNKAHLIEALAVRGFQEFTQSLQHAWEGTPGNSLEKLRATGITYVTFAVRQPALFRLMNRPELRQAAPSAHDGPGPVEQAARASYQVLLDGIRDCQQEGLVDAGEPQQYAITAWSLVHGAAMLSMDGLIGDHGPSEEQAGRLAQMVTGILGQGLLKR